MAESWTIGSAPGCDIVVAQPVVSGRHCKLTRDEDGFTLEDLRSTNGTFVNGMRLNGSTRVKRADTITLGTSVPLPWPGPEPATVVLPGAGGTKVESALRILRIGREPDNDIAIANPVVSSRHARLIWDGVSDHVIVEDLGSSNGTAIGTPANRVQKAPLRASDTLYLGSLAVPAASLLGRFSPGLLGVEAGEVAPDHAGGLSTGVRVGILVGVVPILAGLVVMLGSGRLPMQVSWLGLAAIVCGFLSGALLDGGAPLRRVGTGLGLAFGQCVGLWLIASGAAGLQGGLGTLEPMLLGSAAGVGLGWIAAGVLPGVAWRLAAAPGLLVALGVLGGQAQPVGTAPAILRGVMQLSPSRWAFEGMLQAEASAALNAADALEAYFPAETDRMGPSATAVALATIAAGALGTAFYLTSAGKVSGRPPRGATLRPAS